MIMMQDELEKSIKMMRKMLSNQMCLGLGVLEVGKA
jgi:hypothetical protein